MDYSICDILGQVVGPNMIYQSSTGVCDTGGMGGSTIIEMAVKERYHIRRWFIRITLEKIEIEVAHQVTVDVFLLDNRQYVG